MIYVSMMICLLYLQHNNVDGLLDFRVSLVVEPSEIKYDGYISLEQNDSVLAFGRANEMERNVSSQHLVRVIGYNTCHEELVFASASSGDEHH